MIANNFIIYTVVATLVLFTLMNILLKIRYKTEKSINYFLYFALCYFVGLILTSLRNTISDFLSLVLGVTILALGYIFLYIGIRGLLGLSFGWLNRYLIPVFIVFCGFYLFTHIYYDLHMRIVIFSLFALSYSITLSYFFGQNSLKKLKILNITASICFILIASVFLLRAFNAVTMNYAIEFAYSTQFMVLSPYIALFSTLLTLIFTIFGHLKYKSYQ